MPEIIYRDESYQIMGVLFDVHSNLGGGFSEIVCKDALEYEFKNLNITLIEDEVDLERYSKKKKTDKEPKKSTVQETYELWLEKNSIKEIAAIRKLTTQTIGGHIAKLIETETISITDVLPEEKIMELAKAFKGYKEETLNGLKEQYGDKFTWDELKMYKASL